MKVTVLLPVYNGAQYLGDACNSILQQSFTDFELLIIDDGSMDASAEIVRKLNDQRIRFVENDRNIGLIATLNKGIDLANGELIARMDADDISLSDRLKDQVAFMDAHPNIAISGGLYENLLNPRSPVSKQPADPDEIKCRLFFHTILAHPTVIYRKKVLQEHNLYYNENYKHAEDYELWVRASRIVKISNLNKVLLKYRVHEGQVSYTHNDVQIQNLNRCRTEQLDEFGIEFDDSEHGVHLQISNQDYQGDTQFVRDAEQWLLKLNRHNEKTKFFDKAKFSRILGEYWIAICKSTEGNVHKAFKASEMNSLKFLTFAQKVKYNISI